jgi:SOS response regulatory protein OraA/RecX
MYAKAYIQSEAIKKGKPLIAVRQKMMLKGMPKTIIDEACALYAEDITA